MAEQKGREVRDEKTPKVGGGGEPLAGDDQGRFRGRACLETAMGNEGCIVFLSLLLLLSIASAEKFDAREKKNKTPVGKDTKWTTRKYHYEYTPCSVSSVFIPNHDFGRETSRLDYFKVIAWNVYEDNRLTRVASYGGGGGQRDGGDVAPQRLEQERGSAPTSAGVDSITPQVPLGSDDGEPLVQRSEQEMDSDGVEPVVERLELESGINGGERVILRSGQERVNGGDGEDGGRSRWRGKLLAWFVCGKNDLK